MVIGCRQVGKTYSVREFLRKEYSTFVEINLERNLDMLGIFEGNLDAETIIDKIIITSGKKLIPGRSAIFLDEVQASRNAYSSLKWLAEDGRFDVIASGSFLGTVLFDEYRDETRSTSISPLGYVETLTMYPMDFEEYLWAVGVDDRMIDSVKKSISNFETIDPTYNRILSEHYRRYLIVGGMPEAVETYAKYKDYARARLTIKNIISVLQTDAGKYSRKKADKMKILACMTAVPSQLASDRRRFQFIDIEKAAGGKKRYGEAIEWLINAGMAYRCYNLRSVDPPLSQNLKETMFKVYMCDTGILLGMMDDADPGAIVNSDPFSNNGIVMENAVAAALVKNGYNLYYYAKEGSTLEIDFVSHGPSSEVWLIEVKSGRNKRSKSLNTLLGERDRKRTGFKICDGPLEKDENGAIHLPLYGACFLPESRPAEISSEVPVKDPRVRTLDDFIKGD